MKTCSMCKATKENVIRYRYSNDETVNMCDDCSTKYNFTFH